MPQPLNLTARIPAEIADQLRASSAYWGKSLNSLLVVGAKLVIAETALDYLRDPRSREELGDDWDGRIRDAESTMAALREMELRRPMPEVVAALHAANN